MSGGSVSTGSSASSSRNKILYILASYIKHTLNTLYMAYAFDRYYTTSDESEK